MENLTVHTFDTNIEVCQADGGYPCLLHDLPIYTPDVGKNGGVWLSWR